MNYKSKYVLYFLIRVKEKDHQNQLSYVLFTAHIEYVLSLRNKMVHVLVDLLTCVMRNRI